MLPYSSALVTTTLESKYHSKVIFEFSFFFLLGPVMMLAKVKDSLMAEQLEAKLEEVTKTT